MNVPMKEKYVDEAVGVWMILGKYVDGSVVVCDANRDIFCGLPNDVAEKVVNLQNEFVANLYKILCR